MKKPHIHIDTERMQALLDGELSPAEAAAVREAISASPRLTAEFEAWQLLFEDLGDLPALEPSPAFRERILEQIPAQRPGFLGARAAARAARTRISDEMLQDYLDGELAPRHVARVDRHLDVSLISRTELEEYRAVARAVESLPSLAPSEDFAERVMAEVRVNEIAAMAMAPTTQSGRVIGWIRSHLPSSQRGWAAALGVGVVPVFTLLLVIQSVFAYDLVTLGNLAAFAKLQLSGLVSSIAAALGSTAERWAPSMLVDGVALVGSSPTLLAAAAAAASVAMMASAWVLYRNLFRTPYDELSDARLSF